MNRPSLDPKFRLGVLRLFRKGLDTKEIAWRLEATEAKIWNTLARMDHSRPVEAVAS